VQNIGVIVYDPAAAALHWRFIDDWNTITAVPEDQEYLALLSEDILQSVREMGPENFLQYLEDTLSGVLRITDRTPITVSDLSTSLEQLFLEYVGQDRGKARTSRSGA
jgi:hypothetical protein